MVLPCGLTLPLIIIIIVTVIKKKSGAEKQPTEQTDSRIMHKYEYICGARFPSQTTLKSLLFVLVVRYNVKC